MRIRSRFAASLAFTCLIMVTGSVHAGPAYDLTGTWRLVALDLQQSFCDGSSSQEVVATPVSVTQTDDLVTLTIPDPPDNQILMGRTSSFFIGADSNTADQISVLSGAVDPDANRISGNLVFYDKHGCPDAETGSARFIMTRLAEADVSD
jgi:hypothetical protein